MYRTEYSFGNYCDGFVDLDRACKPAWQSMLGSTNGTEPITHSPCRVGTVATLIVVYYRHVPSFHAPVLTYNYYLILRSLHCPTWKSHNDNSPSFTEWQTLHWLMIEYYLTSFRIINQASFYPLTNPGRIRCRF